MSLLKLVVALLAIVTLHLRIELAHAQAQGDWIYDLFVKNCREAGGQPGTTVAQYRRGEKFDCRQGASGASSTAPVGECEGEARRNIDWIFTDAGARSTYTSSRASGKSAFDSAIAAQGHNRKVQELLLRCRGWTESYLRERGAGGNERGGASGDQAPRLDKRQLSAGDCRCISVLPGGGQFRITNSCELMKVSVLFIEGYMAHGVHPVATSWAQAGVVGGGREGRVRAPPYRVPSIKAVELANAASKWTCNF